MKRITYWDFGKWRMRIGDTEYSGKNVDGIAAIENILGEDYNIGHFIRLVEADREGRCVVLPRRIGEMVYEIHRRIDGADRVRETEFWWSDIPQFGKTVFLTREAAEAALKGEQGEQK